MSHKDGRILIIDDDRFILETARMYLKQEFGQVDTTETPEKVASMLESYTYDVILLDMNFRKGEMDGKEGIRWLDFILDIDPWASVIMITAYGDVNLAVEAIKTGATDFVVKPWKNEKLLASILSAMSLRRTRLQLNKLKDTQEKLISEQDRPFENFIGKSPAMARVFELIQKVADTDANILILGENGTGKELVARALHRLSSRRKEVFLRVDLGAVPETLFESELFGHVKGAFTDAKSDKTGCFELASGGTLFLDEIGNLSMPLQAKLLSVLQMREVRKVGSNKSTALDVRLICATNMPIYEMTTFDGQSKSVFRQDLLYRINTVEIKLPPLRQRIDDIPLLAEHFLHLYSRKYNKAVLRIDPSVIKKLQTYKWPGNVRELQHATEKAVILSEEKVIRDVRMFLHKQTNSDDEKLPKTLEEMESVMIENAMQSHLGNMTKVARELGITRATLYRKMEKYGL
jgi:DNA-binding NtrC family response regulator